MVAGGAGSDQVAPFMFTTLDARNHVIYRQLRRGVAAVLAGVIIPAKHLSLVEFDPYTWSFDHPFKPDDGWPGKFLGYSVNKTTPIKDQAGFAGHHQADGAPRGADIQRLKIRIQDQNWFKHNDTLTLRIIAWLNININRY
jgi:hypothetical protein